jgi:2-polyprenyl-3-methyl-5-hydroxy-6-metoxy-1,4-benzoquinol methylase
MSDLYQMPLEKRFAFGANWSSFLNEIDEERIAEAERSLVDMLGTPNLRGKMFLDAGSGSGLFSLAARRLGATVVSFDYDPMSVACAEELKGRYFPNDPNWNIARGSVLDRRFLDSLGTFDIVYSWGVLHHTGAMWIGLDNVTAMMRTGGICFVSLYNDQGAKSRIWWFIKNGYVSAPRPIRPMYAAAVGVTAQLVNTVKWTLKGKPMAAIRPLLAYRTKRGMNWWHDIKDWVGGFPFEFVRYDTLTEWIENRGFQVVRGRPTTDQGCHEIVFSRAPGSALNRTEAGKTA